MAIDECNAGNGDDTIVVPAGVIQLVLAGSGENEPTGGDLDIRSGVEIIGAGAQVTVVDGGAIERVIHVDPSTNRNFSVTIRGMTIRNGAADAMGGGVFNQGALDIYRTTIAGNDAPEGAGIHHAPLNGGLKVICHDCRIAERPCRLGAIGRPWAGQSTSTPTATPLAWNSGRPMARSTAPRCCSMCTPARPSRAGV